jgi:hypothetical protein
MTKAVHGSDWPERMNAKRKQAMKDEKDRRNALLARGYLLDGHGNVSVSRKAKRSVVLKLEDAMIKNVASGAPFKPGKKTPGKALTDPLNSGGMIGNLHEPQSTLNLKMSEAIQNFKSTLLPK